MAKMVVKSCVIARGREAIRQLIGFRRARALEDGSTASPTRMREDRGALGGGSGQFPRIGGARKLLEQSCAKVCEHRMNGWKRGER